MVLTLKKKILPLNIPASTIQANKAYLDLKDSSLNMKRIKQVRKYVLAKMDGKTVLEAKKEAGITSLTHKQIMAHPIAEVTMNELLAKEKEFCDRGIIDKLKQLWDAEEIAVDKWGSVVRKPDNTAQDKALGRVLHLRGYGDKGADKSGGTDVPTTINFNIVQVPQKTSYADVIDIATKAQ